MVLRSILKCAFETRRDVHIALAENLQRKRREARATVGAIRCSFRMQRISANSTFATATKALPSCPNGKAKGVSGAGTQMLRIKTLRFPSEFTTGLEASLSRSYECVSKNPKRA
jgi:hypothetical protein